MIQIDKPTLTYSFYEYFFFSIPEKCPLHMAKIVYAPFGLYSDIYIYSGASSSCCIGLSCLKWYQWCLGSHLRKPNPGAISRRKSSLDQLWGYWCISGGNLPMWPFLYMPYMNRSAQHISFLVGLSFILVLECLSFLPDQTLCASTASPSLAEVQARSICVV